MKPSTVLSCCFCLGARSAQPTAHTSGIRLLVFFTGSWVVRWVPSNYLLFTVRKKGPSAECVRLYLYNYTPHDRRPHRRVRYTHTPVAHADTPGGTPKIPLEIPPPAPPPHTHATHARTHIPQPSAPVRCVRWSWMRVPPTRPPEMVRLRIGRRLNLGEQRPPGSVHRRYSPPRAHGDLRC